ncbi:unnamed protein product [Trichogramma brassicae]|uniref:Uncharacterized protein n=1 Tax=Trichogramma brassicae TaxID=86971 RepID=A0A6H5I3W6_9HYME|nr:unnamed protein product [Trichogramma brassicae]
MTPTPVLRYRLSIIAVFQAPHVRTHSRNFLRGWSELRAVPVVFHALDSLPMCNLHWHGGTRRFLFFPDEACLTLCYAYLTELE